jgi:hypothetical protein
LSVGRLSALCTVGVLFRAPLFVGRGSKVLLHTGALGLNPSVAGEKERPAAVVGPTSWRGERRRLAAPRSHGGMIAMSPPGWREGSPRSRVPSWRTRSLRPWKSSSATFAPSACTRLAHHPGDAVVPPGAARLLSAWRCSSAVRAGGRTKQSRRAQFDAWEARHAASRRRSAAAMNRRPSRALAHRPAAEVGANT